MSQSVPSLPDADAPLLRALDDYLAALQNGTAPPRREYLARHPELAEELDACLASLDFIRQAAVKPPLDDADGDEIPAADGLPGRVLGDFRILRPVGQGGMGVVYEATQLSLQRRVALKVLPFASTLDPRRLRRFQNEAQAAAQLHHSNIVPVFGTGCERGVHYYAMQFIDGQTLAALIRDQQSEASGRPVEEKAAEPSATGPCVPAAGQGPAAGTQEAALAATRANAALTTERGQRDRGVYRRIAALGV